MPCRTPTAPRSTTPTCWSPRSSVTARRRPGHWPPAGTPTSSPTRPQDGVVLPILHLNGYKIANPTVLARIPEDELRSLMIGYGHEPHFFEVADEEGSAAEEHADVHRRFATLLDTVLDEIAEIKADALGRRRRAAGLADDRLPHPEGLDRTGLHRRQEDHRILARTPGSARQRPRHPRAPAGARGLVGLLPGRGTVRRERHPRPDDRRPRAGRPAADERQPARQRRAAAEGSAPARLPRVRGRRAIARAPRWPRPPGCSADG